MTDGERPPLPKDAMMLREALVRVLGAMAGDLWPDLWSDYPPDCFVLVDSENVRLATWGDRDGPVREGVDFKMFEHGHLVRKLRGFEKDAKARLSQAFHASDLGAFFIDSGGNEILVEPKTWITERARPIWESWTTHHSGKQCRVFVKRRDFEVVIHGANELLSSEPAVAAPSAPDDQPTSPAVDEARAPSGKLHSPKRGPREPPWVKRLRPSLKRRIESATDDFNGLDMGDKVQVIRDWGRNQPFKVPKSRSRIEEVIHQIEGECGY